MGRLPNSATLALALAALTSSGCSALSEFSGTHGDAGESEYSLSALEATEIIARIVRSALPTADPVPYHAGAPFWRHRDAHRIAYGRRSSDHALVAIGNSRVWRTPPTAPPQTAPLQTTKWDGPTTIGGTALVEVRVEPLQPSACRVRIAVAKDHPGLRDRILSALATEMPEHLGRPTAATLSVARLAEHPDPDTRWDIGVATANLHRPERPPGSASRVQRPLTRDRVALLHAERASIASAQREAARLTQSPGQVHQRARWAQQLRAASQRWDSDRCVERANEQLRRGDSVGATYWLDRASTVGLSAERRHEFRARIARSQQDADTAYGHELARLERVGPEPEIVLALHDLCIRRARPEEALRWLARHWNDLAEDRAAAESRLALSAERTGSILAARILASERIPDLGLAMLAKAENDGPRSNTLAAAIDPHGLRLPISAAAGSTPATPAR